MPGSAQLLVESRSARREFTQCQKCYKDKEHDKVKLSVCTGCHIATYCSPTCQKAHWPMHKRMCLDRRRSQQAVSNMDATVRYPDIQTHPLPSELLAELRSFTQKFNAVIFQAGINALKLYENPMWYKDLVLVILLDRLPSVPASRPWSRYTVKMISPLPFKYMQEKVCAGDQGLEELQREQDRHNRETGNLGSITTFISTYCTSTNPPRMLHNVTSYGFGHHSFSAVEISDNWDKKFMENVEKMCGRQGSESPDA